MLLSKDTWRETGRLDIFGPDLFSVSDRKRVEFILGPTHEESVTELLASFGAQSTRFLPQKLYQITSKYRDEMRPRFGLIRAREFLMKDLYSFHQTNQESVVFYEEVCQAYENIFRALELENSIIKVGADAGSMGGKHSHEYHIQTMDTDTIKVGEDELISCSSPDCTFAINSELNPALLRSFYKNREKKRNSHSSTPCVRPGCSGSLTVKSGIEVGHCYLLGSFYSKKLGARSVDSSSNREPLEMGCYGLGMSRLIAALHEKEGLPEFAKDTLVWPRSIAPYRLVVIPVALKGRTDAEADSGTESSSSSSGTESREIELLEQLRAEIRPYLSADECKKGSEQGIRCDDVIIDDRMHLKFKKKQMEAKVIGIEWTLLLGNRSVELRNNYSNETITLKTLQEAMQALNQQLKNR